MDGATVSPFDRKRLLGLIIAAKTVYLLLLCLALRVGGRLEQDAFAAFPHWPRAGPPTFGTYFATWDAAHYLYLAQEGYHRGIESDAFYPLWPALISGSARISGCGLLTAGLLLSNLFSTAAWMLFYQITNRRFGVSVANRALLLLVAFPGALFFQFPYTESLFLLLLMLLWLALEEHRLLLGFASGLLLPLSRAIGVFVMLPILWSSLRTRGAFNLFQFFRLRWGLDRQACPAPFRTTKAASSELWLLAAPLAGCAAYFGVIWCATGSPTEGMKAQETWGVHAISNLWNAPKFILSWFSAWCLHDFRGSFLDRLSFALIVAVLPTLWWAGADLVVWTYVLAVLPAMSGTFTSFTRFASCAFPLFIGLAISLEPPGRRWLTPLCVCAFAAIQLALLWRHVNFLWAG